jgi:hypothetical protein
MNITLFATILVFAGVVFILSLSWNQLNVNV